MTDYKNIKPILSDNQKRCTRCVLPANFRNISFDVNGVCSFCHAHDAEILPFQRYDLAKRLFLEKVEQNKGQYTYDCAVGLSGGKDSTYVLYKMKEIGLKIIAITIDNGWLDKAAKDNIKRIIDDTKVDHVVLGIEKPLLYKLYAGATRSFGWPCIACSYLGLAVAQRYCFDHRIPVLVHGRARNQMLRELGRWSQDSYLPFYGVEYRPHNFSDNLWLVGEQRKALDRIAHILLPEKQMREDFQNKYFIDPKACKKAGFAPRFASLFLMEEYNENKVRSFHEEKVLNGNKMHKSDHSDCMASEAFMYIYKQAYGWSLQELELSLDIRENRINRDLALEKIISERCAFEIPSESFNLVEKHLGITRDEILSSLPEARRNIERFRRLNRIKNTFSPRHIMK